MRPLYETLETKTYHEGGTKEYRVWQLHTGTKAEDFYVSDMQLGNPSPAPCRPRVVDADGRSLIPAPPGETYNSCEKHKTEPSGRMEAVGKDRLVRLRDHTELIVPDRPGRCLQTADGVYSCLSTGRSLLFLAGDDPNHLVTLRGDQLMSLLLRPLLAVDFSSGAPVSPAKDTPIGRAPTLELLHTDYAPALLRLRLHGHGVEPAQGALRIFGGDLTELGPPRPLVDELITEVELPVPGDRCPKLSVYYCNLGGHVCSLPIEVASCAPGARGR